MPPKNKYKNAAERRLLSENGLVQPSSSRPKKQRSTLFKDSQNISVIPIAVTDAADEDGSLRARDTSCADALGGMPLEAERGRDVDMTEAAFVRHAADIVAADNIGMDAASGAGSGPFVETAEEGGDGMPHKLSVDSENGVSASLSHVETNTIVRARSLGDILAILIILFQLHPALVLLVHFIFCALTGPPFEWIFDLLPQRYALNDWLLTPADNPPLWLILVSDLFFAFLCRFIPTDGQNLLLDCAQMVIAVSLGGAMTKYGPWTTHNVLACVSVIGFRHFLAYDAIRQHGDKAFKLLVSKMHVHSVSILDVVDFTRLFVPSRRTWFNAVLEVHIIMQCINRTVIRHVSKSASANTASAGRRSDPEAASAVLQSSLHDGISETSMTQFNDGRQTGSSTAPTKDAKDKSTSTGKRRRKQAVYARSQQPFWAALAFEVLKSKVSEQDMYPAAFERTEQRHQESGYGAAQHVGEDCVWITNIFETEVDYAIVVSSNYLTAHLANGNHNGENTSPPDSANVAEIISIRVNGAKWGSSSVASNGSLSGISFGKIYGLTPSSNYFVEFVDARDERIVHQASLLTRPAANAVQGINATSTSQPSLRPDSPITTLKNSIKAAELQLTEAKSRSKKLRRDHKSVLSHLSREVESFDGRVSGAGGNDARQRQRAIQHEQSIFKADKDRENFTFQIEQLGEMPQDLLHVHEIRKQNWKDARGELARLQANANSARIECERRITNQMSEQTVQAAKTERLHQKLHRLQTQHDAASAELSRSQQEREIRSQQLSSKFNERARVEHSYLSGIGHFEQQRQMFETLRNQIERELHGLDVSASAIFNGNYGLPQTPESSFAGISYGSRPPPGLNSLNSAQHAASSVSAIGSRRGSLYRRNRERKSSMLSDASGFTDENVNGYDNATHDHAARHDSDGSIIQDNVELSQHQNDVVDSGHS